MANKKKPNPLAKKRIQIVLEDRALFYQKGQRDPGPTIRTIIVDEFSTAGQVFREYHRNQRFEEYQGRLNGKPCDPNDVLHSGDKLSFEFGMAFSPFAR